MTRGLYHYYVTELAFYWSLMFSQFRDIKRKVSAPFPPPLPDPTPPCETLVNATVVSSIGKECVGECVVNLSPSFQLQEHKLYKSSWWFSFKTNLNGFDLWKLLCFSSERWGCISCSVSQWTLVAAVGQLLSCDCKWSGPDLIRIIEIPQNSGAGVRNKAADVWNESFFLFLDELYVFL